MLRDCFLCIWMDVYKGLSSLIIEVSLFWTTESRLVCFLADCQVPSVCGGKGIVIGTTCRRTHSVLQQKTQHFPIQRNSWNSTWNANTKCQWTVRQLIFFLHCCYKRHWRSVLWVKAKINEEFCKCLPQFSFSRFPRGYVAIAAFSAVVPIDLTRLMSEKNLYYTIIERRDLIH